ncbi:MAG: hypothetical protein HZA50_12645 [Planctomycetes bacterium]|nr:hypothetical protein [Planctomycetota bacterium]
MSKNEIVWLIIRAVGVYFVARAILVLPKLISFIILLCLNRPFPIESLDKINSAIIEQLASSCAGLSVELVIYVAASIYLLRFGRIIFKLLSYVGPTA